MISSSRYVVWRETEIQRSLEIEHVHKEVESFMTAISYPADTDPNDSKNPIYRAKMVIGELLPNLMEAHKDVGLDVYMKGNKHRVGIYIRCPVKDDFDEARRAEEIKADIDSKSGQEVLASIQAKQARDEVRGRTGHAGLGCMFAQFYSDGIKRRHYIENGQEGTEIFILIKKK